MPIQISETLEKGRVLQSQGDYQGALDVYRILPVEYLIPHEEILAVLLWNIGACHMAMENYLLAARCYKKFLDHYPTRKDFWSNFALATQRCFHKGEASLLSIIDRLIPLMDSGNRVMQFTLFDHLFGRLSSAHERVRFIDIGANDGMTYNPIRPYIHRNRWTGIMVEPNPLVFQRLKRNYDGIADVILSNCCIAAQPGQAEFFVIDQTEDLGNPVIDQISSLDRDHVARHVVSMLPRHPNPLSLIRSIPVTIRRVDDLLAEHGFTGLDLVVIDAEGYDLEILRSLDLARLSPTVILFESKHLPENDWQEAVDMLTTAGFVVVPLGADCLAVRRGFVSDEVLELYGRFAAAARGIHDSTEANKKAFDIITLCHQEVTASGRPA